MIRTLKHLVKHNSTASSAIASGALHDSYAAVFIGMFRPRTTIHKLTSFPNGHLVPNVFFTNGQSKL